MLTSTWLPLASALVALVGGGIALARFRRQDARDVAEISSTLMASMKLLNSELEASEARVRAERDELLTRMKACSNEVTELEREIRRLRGDLHENAADAKKTILGLDKEVRRLVEELRIRNNP